MTPVNQYLVDLANTFELEVSIVARSIWFKMKVPCTNQHWKMELDVWELLMLIAPEALPTYSTHIHRMSLTRSITINGILTINTFLMLRSYQIFQRRIYCFQSCFWIITWQCFEWNFFGVKKCSFCYKRILLFFKRYYKEAPRAAMYLYSLKFFFWFKDSIIFCTIVTFEALITRTLLPRWFN